MRIGQRVVAAAVALLLPGVSVAQADVAIEEEVVQERDRVVYRRVTDHVFGAGAPLEGRLTRPEGEIILPKRRVVFESLVRVRANFAPELHRSVDNL